MPDFSYANMAEARMACVKQFGGIFDLPAMRDHLEPLSTLGPLAGDMLDFGCGPQGLKPVMEGMFPDLAYHSLDADPAYGCDYRKVEDIPSGKTFRLIIANQVLEHLTLEESLALMPLLAERLEKGGIFYATIPNLSHPNRFFADVDHKAYLTYTALFYLATTAHLTPIGMYRYSKRAPRGWIERFLSKHIGAIYRMDWADSIAMLAIKEDSSPWKRA